MTIAYIAEMTFSNIFRPAHSTTFQEFSN